MKLHSDIIRASRVMQCAEIARDAHCVDIQIDEDLEVTA